MIISGPSADDQRRGTHASVGITALSDVDGGVANHIIMAGNLIMMMPILIAFVIAQKQILKASPILV